MRKRWAASREERLALHGGVTAAIVFLALWLLASLFVPDALPLAFALVFIVASLVFGLALWRGRPRDATVLTFGGAAVGAVVTLMVLRLIVSL